MIKRLFTVLSLLSFAGILMAQVPYAFRYQASIRNENNTPAYGELLFDINIYNDADASDNVYHETHVEQPDTNGLVAFSIGLGLSNTSFEDIVWATGPYYIQIMINGEEISYSQLISVPYAMHAQTASSLYDLQEPIKSNDPTTKLYVDSLATLNTINTTEALEESKSYTAEALEASKDYADSLAITPKDLDVAAAGDTLTIGSTSIIIPGMSSDNMEKYTTQRLLGGSYQEQAVACYSTSDDNIMVLGTTQSNNGDISKLNGEVDIFITKLNQDLDIIWAKTLGGSAYDNVKLMIEETDGYLIAGTTESSDGDVSINNGAFDIWLIKLSNDGDIVWEQTYGGAETEFISTLLPKDDGGYYVGGSTFSTSSGDVGDNAGDSDIWIFELDNTHRIIQRNTIGGSNYDCLVAMEYDTNGNLKLYASSASNSQDITDNNGALDYVVLTLDNSLKVENSICYGSTKNEQLVAHYTINNGTILVGNSFSEEWSASSSKQHKNIFIQMTGASPWEHLIGGSLNDEVKDIAIRNDTIMILGHSSSQDEDITDAKGAYDIWVITLLTDGTLLSKKNFGGTYNDYAEKIKPLDTGGWMIIGNSESADSDLSSNAGGLDIWTLTLNNELNITDRETYGGSFEEKANNILFLNDDTYIIYGTTSSDDFSITGLHDMAGKSSDIWLLKVSAE